MKNRTTARRGLITLAIASVICAPRDGLAAGATDLPAAEPESVGVDSRPLVELSRWIRAHDLDVRSFVVVKDGKVVFERYVQGVTRNHNFEQKC
jgi:hypothetical protein